MAVIIRKISVKHALRLLVCSTCFTLALSCQTLTDATSLAAQAAGDAGLISREMAQAIVKSGDAASKAAEEINPEQSYYIGRAVGATILGRYTLDMGNAELSAYLNRIVRALAVNSPLRQELDSSSPFEPFNGYHVGILDSQEINAFATSGGHIFVTKGLIACAGSEDALAAVLAHEMAHIQLQHGIEAIKADRRKQVVTALAELAGTAAGGTALAEVTELFSESVTDVVNTLYTGYTKEQEFTADALAVTFLASAGYEPSGLIEMLRTLAQAQASKPGGLSQTHPAPMERINNVQSRVDVLQAADTRDFRKARFNAVK